MTPTKTQTTNSEKKTKSVGREWGKENIIRVQCKLLIDMWPVEKSQWHKYDKYFWMANDRLTVFLMLYIIRITAHHWPVQFQSTYFYSQSHMKSLWPVITEI